MISSFLFVIASVLPHPDQTSPRNDLVTQSFENKALETNQEPEDRCKNLSNSVTRDGVTDMKENCATIMNSSPRCCQRIDLTSPQKQGVTPDSKMSDDCVTKPQPPRPKCVSDWLKSPAFYKVMEYRSD